VRYRLVLQWTGSSIKDYDDMVELEGRLDGVLAGDGEIDGHDVGVSGVNIFVHTDDAEKTFAMLRPMLAAEHRLDNVRVAFRELCRDEYTVLWPSDLTTFEIS
jgi:hypothetical protein